MSSSNNSVAVRHGGAGKGGKGLGKGGAAQQHRKKMKDSIEGVTKPALRRLARRGGVKRISGDIYTVVREALRDRLDLILKDAITYTTHANRKTVTTFDVVLSLKRNGAHIYGFGM